jgi:two-component system response regulator NreC
MTRGVGRAKIRRMPARARRAKVAAVKPEERAAEQDAITIVIADDHVVVRTGLRLILDAEEGFEVRAEADDVQSARRYVRAHRPKVLVLDLNMPGEPSLSAIPSLREESPETQIVVLTMQDDPAFAREALKAGALGFVLKRAAESELIEAVRLAARGELYLNPQLGARIVVEPPPGPPDGLSPEELTILRLVALGHTNAEIGEQLFLSGRTVETHRIKLQRRLGLETRAQLVSYVLDNGLLDR